jgi:hypothetical protein
MTAALLACVLLAAGAQQTASPPQQPTATATPAQEPSTNGDLPVSLERIERALAAPPPAVDFKEQHPVFRVEIYGRKPTLEDLLGERFWVGPAPYGGMTHEEFMTMSTPKEMQPYAGFTGKYLVAETALTLAEQWALKSALHKLKDAKTNHERDAARKEVLDALAELEKARKAAGLDSSR